MSISFSCSIDINWTKFVKDSLFAIAGSYVAGYLFYIFSVLYPKSKQIPPLFKLMLQQIGYAKSALMDLSFSTCGKYDINDVGFKSSLKKRIGDSIEVSQENCKAILQTMNNVHLLMQFTMSKIEFLYSEYVNNLSEVIRIVSRNISRILDIKPEPMLFGEREFNEFGDGIVKVYNLLDETYSNLEKFIK